MCIRDSLKVLYLVGKNPTLSPKALENLDLLVVQDLFMTESAREAHVVLPASSFIEKFGTYTNLEGRIQKLHPLREPKGQSKPDVQIFLDLLHLLEIPVDVETPEAIFEKMAKDLPRYRSNQAGETQPKGFMNIEEAFPNGKAKLIPLDPPRSQPQPEGYPFSLIQIPLSFQSGELSLRSENLKRVMEKPSLKMNIEDARSMKIDEGEVVELSTPQGTKWQMRVTLSSLPAHGVLMASLARPIGLERQAYVQVKKLKAN